MIQLRPSNNIYLIERIISALSYPTAGMVGFIWWIIAIILKKSVRPFLIYHILQSIFISIAYYILLELYKLIFVIFAKIPLLNSLIFSFNNLINGSISIFYGYSLLQILTIAAVLYLSVTSFCGLYSYIPWVSDIINGNTGRK